MVLRVVSRIGSDGHFRVGTTQVNISGLYNSAQDQVARRIHAEILAAVSSRPLASD